MTSYEIRPAGATDTGNVRESNQDMYLAKGELLAVADGMGGANGGETASRVAIDALEAAFPDDPTVDSLVDAVRAANRAVWEQAQSDPELRGMGTTIAVVARVNDAGDEHLTVVNVGDSRVYRLRDGQLSQLSSDHSLVADLIKIGAVSEADARTHPDRHVLTQAVGVAPDVEPYVATTDLDRGDRLLLCSDGLTNEVDDDEIARALAAASDPREAADHLVQLAKDNGGHDNITTVVVDIA
jgi:PPM family protein phosphatase